MDATIDGPFKINFATNKLERIDFSDKLNLPRGTILHLNGYNCPDLVIIDREESRFGVNYHAINLDSFTQSFHTAHSLKWLKDKTSDMIQTYITDRTMSEEDIQAAARQVIATKIETERKAKEAAEAKEREIAMIKEKYSYLSAICNGPCKSGHALGSANIRVELKRAFPGVKFAVRSQSYSGGNSINIDWTDGPTTKQVEAITGKYQEGNFNGMEDIYEYGHRVWPSVFGGAKYVFENRHLTREFVQKVADEKGTKITFSQYGSWKIDTDKGWEYERSMEHWFREDLNNANNA